MREILSFFWNDIFVFLIVLTIVVFVHEFGHYIVAKWNGVKIETFSIGFGPELFGWNDKSGTRWRFSLLPLGGYVKMFGDADPTSTPDLNRNFTEEEKSKAFHFKKIWQRSAVVFAGPGANFLFGIITLSVFLVIYGEVRTKPIIGEIVPHSAAEQAELRTGDTVIEANGKKIKWFQDLKMITMMSTGEPIVLKVLRDGSEIPISTQPQMRESKDVFGNIQKIPTLGILASQDATEYVTLNPLEAIGEAVVQTTDIISGTLVGIGQIIVGRRSTKELGGPIRIAKEVSHASKLGFRPTVWLTILLSINLGLINLFPIPVLDGGRLVFYAIEAIIRRPLSEKMQDYGMRIGLFLVFALMIFAVGNDLMDIKLFEKLKALVS
jgi:regulator of sigma E protease